MDFLSFFKMLITVPVNNAPVYTVCFALILMLLKN